MAAIAVYLPVFCHVAVMVMNTDNHGNKSCKLTQREGASRYPTACTEQSHFHFCYMSQQILLFVQSHMARPFLLCSNGSGCGHSEQLVSCIQQKAEQSIVVQTVEVRENKSWVLCGISTYLKRHVTTTLWLALPGCMVAQVETSCSEQTTPIVQSSSSPLQMTAQRFGHTRLLFAKYGQRTRDCVYTTFVELAVSSLGGHGNTTCSTEETTEYPQHHLVIDWEGGNRRLLEHYTSYSSCYRLSIFNSSGVQSASSQSTLASHTATSTVRETGGWTRAYRMAAYHSLSLQDWRQSY